ncbi:MAG: autotransporter domain-containing protein [Endomicrobium sp.]|jgi:predicted outer membrane repeat protein|nr:autotransporter domain-containing protein [Endomicrobium sp.]
MNIKRLKVIRFIILLFCNFLPFYCYADIDFITQSDINDDSKWSQISNSNPGIFFGDFDISSPRSIADNSIIGSNSQSIKRTLSASNNKFFNFDAGQGYVTINNITLQKGSHRLSGSNNGGGAIYTDTRDFNLNGTIVFEQNTSSACGGAVYAGGNIWISNPTDTIAFLSNTSAYNGGALCAVGTATFYGGAYFINNKALHSGQAYDGGAIYSSGSVIFMSPYASVELSSNVAAGNGGAIFALNNIGFSSNTIISYNKADGNGGAIYSSAGYVSFRSYVTAIGNETTSSQGGAIFSKGIIINDGATFSDNKSAQEGGAIYVYDSTFSYIGAITSDVLFNNNSMAIKNEIKRNDIYMGGHSTGASLNTLTLDTRDMRSITLNSGIRCSSSGNDVINKIGRGTLNLNGDFILTTFNVLDGYLSFGEGSSFKSDNVSFSSSATVNLDRKKDYVIEISTFSSSALFYYDLDLQSNNIDKFVITNSANLDGTKVKISFVGVNKTTVTYNFISSLQNAQGNILIDNTNGQGNIMHRVNSYITYDTGNHTSWKSANLNIYVNELNNIDSLTDNERQVAFSLDGDYGKSQNDLFHIIDVVDKMASVSDKKNALLNLSGHIYANAITVPTINTYKNNILSRLDRSYYPNNDSFYKRNFWVQGFNAQNNFKGTLESPEDFNILSNGAQVGFDTLREDSRIFGIAIGYRDMKSKQNRDKIDIKGYNVGSYLSIFFENNFEIKTFVIGERQSYFASRNIDYLNRNTSADFEGYSLNSSGEISYNYYISNNFCMKPFVDIDYSHVTRNEFSETGAEDANLIVFDGSYNRVNSSLGIKVNNGINSKFKWCLSTQADLLCFGKEGNFKSSFKNGTQKMDIKGLKSDMVSTSIGAGILYDASKDLSVYLNLNGRFSQHQNSYYGNVGFNYKFTTQPTDFYKRA